MSMLVAISRENFKPELGQQMRGFIAKISITFQSVSITKYQRVSLAQNIKGYL